MNSDRFLLENQYFIDFLLVETPGISFTGHVPSKPLASQSVDVAFDPTPRKHITSRAPPAYATEQATSYDTSLGVLVAANQRFLHHGHSGV